MKVTPEILKALNRAKDYYGNTTQLAKHLGIAHSTILFWFSGKTKNISGQLWCRLLKEELAPFMADSDEKRKEQGRKEVYCVSCTQFMQFDPTMESPCHFAESHGSAIDFSDKKSVALRLDGSVEFGHFPFDTCFVISCDEYPQDNQIVILKMRSGEILVRLFLKQEEKVLLKPLYGAEKVLRWPLSENAQKILWIFPVSSILFRS